MKKRIALLAAVVVSGLGVFAATAPQALAASCTNAPWAYADDPSPGYVAYGERANCNGEINTYKLSVCLKYTATGQTVTGSCHTVQGSIGWVAYSVSTPQYTMYLPNSVVYANGSYYITFK